MAGMNVYVRLGFAVQQKVGQRFQVCAPPDWLTGRLVQPLRSALARQNVPLTSRLATTRREYIHKEIHSGRATVVCSNGLLGLVGGSVVQAD